MIIATELANQVSLVLDNSGGRQWRAYRFGPLNSQGCNRSDHGAIMWPSDHDAYAWTLDKTNPKIAPPAHLKSMPRNSDAHRWTFDFCIGFDLANLLFSLSQLSRHFFFKSGFTFADDLEMQLWRSVCNSQRNAPDIPSFGL